MLKQQDPLATPIKEAKLTPEELEKLAKAAEQKKKDAAIAAMTKKNKDEMSYFGGPNLRDSLLKDMLFVSSYQAFYKERKKAGFTKMDAAHYGQTLMFAILFALLGPLGSVPALFVSYFFTISGLDSFKSFKLWSSHHDKMANLDKETRWVERLTATFFMVGWFAAIATLFEEFIPALMMFTTASVIPWIFLVVVSAALTLKISQAYEHWKAWGNETDPLLQSQHRAQFYDHLADAIVTTFMLAGVVTLFVLNALFVTGLVSTAIIVPPFIPIIIGLGIVCGLLFKLYVKKSQSLQPASDLITLKAENFFVAANDQIIDDRSTTERSTLEGTTVSDTEENLMRPSEVDDDPEAPLISQAKAANTSSFFYTKGRAESISKAHSLGQQKATLLKEISALKIDASQDVSEHIKTQEKIALLSSLENYINESKKEDGNGFYIFDRTAGATQLLTSRDVLHDLNHKESDLQDLTKATLLFLHERARVRTMEKNVTSDYEDYAPSYQLQRG